MPVVIVESEQSRFSRQAASRNTRHRAEPALVFAGKVPAYWIGGADSEQAHGREPFTAGLWTLHYTW